MALKEITRKVISYCEIPRHITADNFQLNEASCGSYIDFKVMSRQFQDEFDDDFTTDNWIIDNYPELEGEEIFIHIDY